MTKEGGFDQETQGEQKMTDETFDQDLAKKAVSCEAWRWLPGMLVRDPLRGGYARRLDENPDGFFPWHTNGSIVIREALPDFSDPATVGCLLSIVREIEAESLDQHDVKLLVEELQAFSEEKEK